MSTAVNGFSQGFHFETSEARSSADTNLNGFGKVDLEEICSPKLRRCNSMLEFCKEAADKLPQRQAFNVIDLADVLWKVQEWKRRLPNVEIFYAVKANTDPILLQLVCKLGLSFDCASAEEIQMTLDSGASPRQIIFAHTIKPEEELSYASEKGVNLMTFDNEDELLKIHRVYPDARLLVRLRPTTVNCIFDLGDKFGRSEDDALRLLQLAKQLNISVDGVCFHVGGLCSDPESYTSTITTCRHLFDTAREMGFDFTILDIGGGFFGESGKEDLFYKTADSINGALKKHFSDTKVRIIAEPGTYIMGSSASLVCTVIGRRCFDSSEEGRPRRIYFLNDSIYGSFFKQIELYGIQPVPLLTESEVESRAKFESRIFGQTCCSEDVLRPNVVLPNLEIGERVSWTNMGAYTKGLYSTFCGMPLPVPRYVYLENNRLNLEWIENKEDVYLFLKKHATFISNKSEYVPF